MRHYSVDKENREGFFDQRYLNKHLEELRERESEIYLMETHSREKRNSEFVIGGKIMHGTSKV